MSPGCRLPFEAGLQVGVYIFGDNGEPSGQGFDSLVIMDQKMLCSEGPPAQIGVVDSGREGPCRKQKQSNDESCFQ